MFLSLASIKLIKFVEISEEEIASNDDWPSAHDYYAMRTFDHFCYKLNRQPEEKDMSALLDMYNKLSNQVDMVDETLVKTKLSELIVCARSPEVCAPVMGGIISHEAVKLITGQFIPINNALFYDGRNKSLSSHLLTKRS